MTKKKRTDAVGRTQEAGAEMNLKRSIATLCEKIGMSRRDFYKGRKSSSRRVVSVASL